MQTAELSNTGNTSDFHPRIHMGKLQRNERNMRDGVILYKLGAVSIKIPYQKFSQKGSISVYVMVRRHD